MGTNKDCPTCGREMPVADDLLSNIARLSQFIRDCYDENDADHAETFDLLDNLDQLDDWLQAGGALPQAWYKAKGHYYGLHTSTHSKEST